MKIFYCKKLILILSTLIMTCSMLYAKVFKPLQIYLPGNFNGKAASFDMGLKIKFGPFWLLPSLADSLLYPKTKDTLAIGLGNNANIFSPVSFLFKGEVEDYLIESFKPNIRTICVSELELFADKYLPQNMLNWVWTNHLTAEGTNLCRWYSFVPFSGGELLVLNFIEPSLCEHLPLCSWNVKTEQPIRSLLRIKNLLPNFSDNQITLSLAYLNKKNCLALAKEFKRMNGIHIIVQIPINGLKSEFSELSIERQKNVFIFSLPVNTGKLPIIEVLFKNFGLPRLKLKHPSAQQEAPLNNSLLQIEAKIKNEITKPLKIISPSTAPSNGMFSFKPKMQAQMLKDFNRANAAILRRPETNYFVDNVICKGHIFASIKNDRVYTLNLNGRELTELLSKLLYKNAHLGLVFSGIELQWTAHRLTKLKIANGLCEADRRYFINTTEKTLEYLKNFGVELYSKSFYKGDSLWKVWLSQLKNSHFSDNEFVE